MMEEFVAIGDVSDYCRMCISDLSEVGEFYAIDEELQTLVETLTGISVGSSV